MPVARRRCSCMASCEDGDRGGKLYFASVIQDLRFVHPYGYRVQWHNTEKPGRYDDRRVSRVAYEDFGDRSSERLHFDEPLQRAGEHADPAKQADGLREEKARGFADVVEQN